MPQSLGYMLRYLGQNVMMSATNSQMVSGGGGGEVAVAVGACAREGQRERTKTNVAKCS